MILIADSGSTKTDWCVAEKGSVLACFRTQGMNPYYQTEKEMYSELTESLLPSLKEYEIEKIFFYGAGCAFSDKNEVVRNAIFKSIGLKPEISSDLLGAARALCRHSSGIACILGTGSNSCYFDGKNIIHTVSPLGFILGDEGSGAVLGKLLIGDCLKNQLSTELEDTFFKETGLTVPYILDRVYRQPFPNRFLASVVPFMAQHIEEPGIRKIVKEAFQSFFIRNVMQYNWKEEKIHCVGSIAWHFRELLLETANELGIGLNSVCQSPMEGLIYYHS